MKLKCKKLHPNAVTPRRGSEDAVGYDLYATSVGYNHKKGYVQFGTGIALEIPQGYGGFVFPRSSIRKKPYSLANSVGVIDPDYRGEIFVSMRYNAYSDPTGENQYHIGDAVAQLVVIKTEELEFEEIEELTQTVRGIGGHGSTDNVRPK